MEREVLTIKRTTELSIKASLSALCIAVIVLTCLNLAAIALQVYSGVCLHDFVNMTRQSEYIIFRLK